MTVRERVRGYRNPATIERLGAPTYRIRVEEAGSWPLDFTSLECKRGQVTFSAGLWGTAPLYAASADGVLHGSWDLVDLRDHIRADVLDDAAVARLLTYWRRYSCRTLWRDVMMLTERAQASFDRDGLAIMYPAPATHSRARELREGVDPIAALDALLTDSIMRRDFHPAGSVVELSGGLDSATVAVSLADAHPGKITCCAMMIGGAEGAQQARRRRDMIEHVGLREDVQIAGMAFPPLNPFGDRGRGAPVHPDEEPFAEATAAMLDALAERGVRTAFTGIGGDEMLALREWERDTPLDQDHMMFPEWVTQPTIDALIEAETDLAPAGAITEVTLLAFACRWPLYLRAGVWPVSPLATPDLIRFGEWLPVEWRRRKRLFRERLARRGLSDEVVNPPLAENLSGMMGRGLRRYGVPMLREMLAGSLILADLGYVDADQLRAACVVADVAAESDIDRRIFPVIALELALRALTESGDMPPPGP
ncbi:MAG: asparagine synthase-related protein [Micromonosporaceae bacterium]